ncbi:hypothetical protein BCA37_21375 [Mycobacterium sp. djl-10]|nr:hypothetical protein BCA37_21375 [Mycobacterium sp. djl-10]
MNVTPASSAPGTEGTLIWLSCFTRSLQHLDLGERRVNVLPFQRLAGPVLSRYVRTDLVMCHRVPSSIGRGAIAVAMTMPLMAVEFEGTSSLRPATGRRP